MSCIIKYNNQEYTEQQFRQYINNNRSTFQSILNNPNVKPILGMKNKLPRKIDNIVNKILQHDGLMKYKDVFSNIEFLPLIANRVNHLAKIEDYSWYDDKDIILRYLIKNHPRNWTGLDHRNNEVLYIETPFDQVSFHIFDNTIKLAEKYGMSGYEREGVGYDIQFKSLDVMMEAIDSLDQKESNKNKVYKRMLECT